MRVRCPCSPTSASSKAADGYLSAARGACGLPVLRKDFIVDAYQVYETRALGADCLLLIVAALQESQLNDLAQLTREVGLDVLVEVHGQLRARVGAGIEAASGRYQQSGLGDIHDQPRHHHRSAWLGVPDDITVVTESGIHTVDDVRRMRAAGVHAFLVGTAFMRAADPGAALRRLFG